MVNLAYYLPLRSDIGDKRRLSRGPLCQVVPHIYETREKARIALESLNRSVDQKPEDA